MTNSTSLVTVSIFLRFLWQPFECHFKNLPRGSTLTSWSARLLIDFSTSFNLSTVSSSSSNANSMLHFIFASWCMNAFGVRQMSDYGRWSRLRATECLTVYYQLLLYKTSSSTGSQRFSGSIFTQQGQHNRLKTLFTTDKMLLCTNCSQVPESFSIDFFGNGNHRFATEIILVNSIYWQSKCFDINASVFVILKFEVLLSLVADAGLQVNRALW